MESDAGPAVAGAEPQIVGGNRTRWGYTFEAVDGGTRMTESWDFLPAGEEFFAERYGDEAEAEIVIRAENARSGIHATLAAIKKAGRGPLPGRTERRTLRISAFGKALWDASTGGPS